MNSLLWRADHFAENIVQKAPLHVHSLKKIFYWTSSVFGLYRGIFLSRSCSCKFMEVACGSVHVYTWEKKRKKKRKKRTSWLNNTDLCPIYTTFILGPAFLNWGNFFNVQISTAPLKTEGRNAKFEKPRAYLSAPHLDPAWAHITFRRLFKVKRAEIPKFLKVSDREIPFHLIFLAESPEFLVEWFTFRKCNIFQIFRKNFPRKFPYHLPRFQKFRNF